MRPLFLHILAVALMLNCSGVHALKSAVLTTDWEKIRPLLVNKAKNNNGCDWDLSIKNVTRFEMEATEVKLDFMLADEIHASPEKVDLFFATFDSYCGAKEPTAVVSSRILRVEGEYNIMSLSLVEE